MILYEGRSMYDGAPIVVIATGYKRRSKNRKTKRMVQTWILRADEPPTVASKNGNDVSICGFCKFRGFNGKKRACYVNLRAPNSVWRAYQRGSYLRVSPSQAADIVKGLKVRIGSYGDPAAAPVHIWENLQRNAAGVTGYSHVGLNAHWALRNFIMFSADDEASARAAWTQGYRTFRVKHESDPLLPGEIYCPSDRVSCEDCGLCDGLARVDIRRLPNVAINAHGVGKKYA